MLLRISAFWQAAMKTSTCMQELPNGKAGKGGSGSCRVGDAGNSWEIIMSKKTDIFQYPVQFEAVVLDPQDSTLIAGATDGLYLRDIRKKETERIRTGPPPYAAQRFRIGHSSRRIECPFHGHAGATMERFQAE